MDCHTALEILEVVRPDSADRMEPEVVEASDHVENCRLCEDHFLARRHFDRRLGQMMREVPVPPGLKSRLLAELGFPETSPDPVADAEPIPVRLAEPDEASVPQGRARRRARMLAFVSSALALTVLVTFFVVRSSQSPAWTLAELRHEARTAFQSFEELPIFNGDFDARLPEHGWESRAISIVEPPRGFPPDLARHSAALYYFALRDGRRPPVVGILLVTTKQSVTEPPENPYFNAEGVGSGPLSTVAWTEGEFVYVCVIDGGGNSLERLERALRLTQAA